MTIQQFERNYHHNEIDSSDIRAITTDIRESFLRQFPKVSKIASKEIVPWLEEGDLFVTFRFYLTKETQIQLQEHYPEALI